MNTRKLLLLTAATGLFVLGLAAPAGAAPGESTASVTVTGGVLAITVPAAAGSLGTRQNTVTAGVISGPLGQVQVNDARSALAGSSWTASVISTAFTPTAGPTIAASAVGYTAGAIVQTGTATYVANDPGDLTGTIAAITATGITGDNSATWTPTINVTVAGGTAVGTYTAIITHSLV